MSPENNICAVGMARSRQRDDLAEAVDLLENSPGEGTNKLMKLALAGYAQAEYLVGEKILFDGLYGNFQGVMADEAAFYWHREAASKGHVEAAFETGKAYHLGRGVERDDVAGLRWLHVAASNGFIDALLALGISHQDGYGVPQDFEEAACFYAKAAEAGHCKAQYFLGRLYFKGHIQPDNPGMAYFWFMVAAAQGCEDAAGLCDLVRSMLTPGQVSTAQRAARTWLNQTKGN